MGEPYRIFYRQAKMTDLAQFIRDLNNTWLEGRFDDLHAYFNANVVMLPPGEVQPVVGVDAMVESYREFGSLGIVHSFEILEVVVHEFGPLAVCQVSFVIDYEMQARRFRENGLEVYALDTSRETPQVVWRTQIPGRPPTA